MEELVGGLEKAGGSNLAAAITIIRQKTGKLLLPLR